MLRPSSRRSRAEVQPRLPSPVSFDAAYPGIRKAYYIPESLVEVPEMLTLPTSRRRASLKSGRYTIPEDFVAILPEPLICTTNSVVMPDARNVLVESMNGADTFTKSLRPVAPAAFENIRDLDGYSTLFDSNFNGYYHQLIEIIPRLLALNRPPYTKIDEIKLLCRGPIYPITAYVLSGLSELQFRTIQPEKGLILRAEHLLFSTFKSRQFSGYLPRPYAERIRAATAPPRPPARRHRIFISRERSNRRRIRNEDELMHALSKIGFEKYVLEDFAPEEQAKLFYDAEAVVGTHGAGLTNVVFSPQVKVLELFPRDMIEPHYLFLCKSLGHTYRFWRNTNGTRMDPEYLIWKLRKLMPKRSFDGDEKPPVTGRSINISYSVDVKAVSAILSEMGLR